MKHLTQSEYDALMAARAERDEYARAMAATPLEVLARTLIREAARRGEVVTIEQRSLTPLAMGNYESVVTLRKARQ